MVRIVDGRRVTVHRSGLVGLLGLTTCGLRGIGQVAKLLGARAVVRLMWSTARRRRCGRESGVEMTVWEQQGRRMKHESGEGETKICDMHMQQTFYRHLSHACTRCLYVTQRKCACDRSVCVHPPSHTLWLLRYVCEIMGSSFLPTTTRHLRFRQPCFCVHEL